MNNHGRTGVDHNRRLDLSRCSYDELYILAKDCDDASLIGPILESAMAKSETEEDWFAYWALMEVLMKATGMPVSLEEFLRIEGILPDMPVIDEEPRWPSGKRPC